jgi:hypothetical protein
MNYRHIFNGPNLGLAIVFAVCFLLVAAAKKSDILQPGGTDDDRLQTVSFHPTSGMYIVRDVRKKREYVIMDKKVIMVDDQYVGCQKMDVSITVKQPDVPDKPEAR